MFWLYLKIHLNLISFSIFLDPGYLGCFNDSDIDYTTRVAIGTRNLTTQSCLDQCHEPFWTPRPQYAGPMGDVCVCFSARYFSSSETRPDALDDADCNLPCDGDINDVCGGRGSTGEIELIPVYDCTSFRPLLNDNHKSPYFRKRNNFSPSSFQE